ncbi:maleylpyruvate isomerase N-terminal domain-containing protein [Yinghuangia soli]|uniref:Maleylpyruvate isomerase N-terminal domain-containing protein n=1 Tax=Yinghuangia soli TaxID=2908204 RepID=A0AA41Q4I4_9ACTN|nr:maleylpyruvate isomerase N-terminal domain-containing protein [Yinghuangia soli]MCF2531408.1 maleylpyruvate isomerase N-terminal domain-containing protein [Yinghuangia soli]
MNALPAALRDRVMGEAVRRRPPAVQTGPHARAYAHAVASLDAMLRSLTADEWALPVRHDWDVQRTVVHLMAGDGALCAAARVPEAVPLPRYEGLFAEADIPGSPGAGWAGRSTYVLSRHSGRPFRMSWHAWRAQSRSLLGCPAARDRDETAIEYAGRRMSLADAFLARGFETWLHGDDIGRAVGRPMPEPADESMALLVGLGLAMLSKADLPAQTRLALTGPGAADARLGVGPVAAELTMSTSDFCRLLGGNRRADEIAVRADGDADAAEQALAAIAAMAIL